MRKWQLVGALSVGIMASGSGYIQAQAADYVFFTDFSTKEVANFNDYTPIFLDTTNNLDNTLQWTFNTFYRMNSCLPAVAQNITLSIRYRLNGTGTQYTHFETLPDMTCQAGDTFYQITKEFTIPTEHLTFILSDDLNYILFQPQLIFESASLTPGRVITLTDPEFVFTLSYDFNTTYLFNYFLSDSGIQSMYSDATSTTGTWSHNFDYVMTTAGNDRYFIVDNGSTVYPVGTYKKFAIDYNMEYFRGESIGARYKVELDGFTSFTMVASGTRRVYPIYNYFYLNAANNTQAIVDVPEFNFEYQDCGSFLALNVGCFINNGLAYITNDAPIISDAITLLNAGMKLAGQAFGVIGSFSDNNVFGVLILGGLGLIAVRWFLKND